MMSNDKTDEPAFPVLNPVTQEQYSGMTLRDYFAGQALTGAISSCLEAVKATKDVAKGDAKVIAGFSYEIADAMIAAAQKEEG